MSLPRSSASALFSALVVGVLSALFEGVMYVFVFMWTPALEARMAALVMGAGVGETAVGSAAAAAQAAAGAADSVHVGGQVARRLVGSVGGVGGGVHGGDRGDGAAAGGHGHGHASGLEHGVVFALFMVWKMAGASCCTMLSTRLRVSPSTCMLIVFSTSCW